MTTASEIASRYGVTRPSSQNPAVYRIPCPAHTGHDKNLAIWDGDGGGLGAKCWSHDCSYQDILDALGVEYVYRGLRYERADGSTVERQRRPGKDMRGNYGSPRDLKARVWSLDDPTNILVICEGEKAAHALDCLAMDGYTAAAWTGGAQAVTMTDFSLARERNVIIWPDADDEGRKAGLKAARMCADHRAASVRVVDTAELPPGADAADVGVEKARELLDRAEDPFAWIAESDARIARDAVWLEQTAPRTGGSDEDMDGVERELTKLAARRDYRPADALELNIEHIYELDAEEGDTALPTYRIQIDGERRDIDDLLDQRKFIKLVHVITGRKLPMLKTHQWDAICGDFGRRKERITPGHPAHPGPPSETTEMREWVRDYLESATNYCTDDDDPSPLALDGRSYEHLGKVYLCLADFGEWLRRIQGEPISPHKIAARLKDINWQRVQVNVRKPDRGRTKRSRWIAG